MFQVAEHGLDPLLSSKPAANVGVGADKGPNHVAGILAHEAGNAALWPDGTLRLQFAGGAIGWPASVHADLAGPVGAAIAQQLVRRAAIDVRFPVVAEGITSEAGILLAAAVDDWRQTGLMPAQCLRVIPAS